VLAPVFVVSGSEIADNTPVFTRIRIGFRKHPMLPHKLFKATGYFSLLKNGCAKPFKQHLVDFASDVAGNC
jgi:hypothetical protein